ncbi:hypothetical protein KZO85_05620 [Chromohalobacter canadensis]|nr:hypothetical protein [Chromohalobacter canadensis]MCT8468045.1 hypothetical protein [Chromohalobacter canadensis]MCT8498542.1 hypothetical protein [Chromohalobacter canadensis]
MDTMTTMSDMSMGMAVISVRPGKPRKATAEAPLKAPARSFHDDRFQHHKNAMVGIPAMA